MLFDLAEEAPRAELTIDLATQTVSFPGGSFTFPIDPFNKTCLLNGVDELGYIMGFENEIAAFETKLDESVRQFTQGLLWNIQIYDTTLRDGTAIRRLHAFEQ